MNIYIQAIYDSMWFRHGINSRIGIDEQFWNWNCLLKKIRTDKFGIEVCYKIFYPQINFLTHQYLTHDNPTRNINFSE